jgi:hypothetical protein
MDEIDARIMKQIREALADAQKNYEQSMANVNYWKGRMDGLAALLEPPKPAETPETTKKPDA